MHDVKRVSLGLKNRIATIRWALPLSLALIAVLYQLGPARWINDNLSDSVQFGAELLFYTTTLPLLTFWTLAHLDRWLDEKELAEKQTFNNERRLASITASSADAILSLNSQGRIESWNHGAELLFGYVASEMHGHPFSDLWGGGPAAEVELRWLNKIVQQTGSIRGHETTCRTVDGRMIHVDLTATLLPGDQGEPAGMSIILRDVTGRKRHDEETRRLNARLNQQAAERTRELAQKVEELGQANVELHKLDQTRSEFVSLVSHQIRAPLTNMGGAVQRMQADCQAINPTCTRTFTILEHQVTRLDRLVQDVLNASSLEAGEMSLQLEPVSVPPIVQQAAEQLCTRTSTRPVRLPDKPGLPLVYADRDRLTEVLANLLDNADKYSPAGEEIAIQVRADQTEVTVSVRDAGPGIPPGDFERVFDKFYRTDSSDSQVAYGYGLGLYVCRRLVEAQGGRIWAENHPDRGAIFSFALPVWQD